MPRPVLSPPPSLIQQFEDKWRKWMNDLYDRVRPGPFPLTGYTVATLPPAGEHAGSDFSSLVYVSDEAGGATLAFSDGVQWRRVTDRASVS